MTCSLHPHSNGAHTSDRTERHTYHPHLSHPHQHPSHRAELRNKFSKCSSHPHPQCPTPSSAPVQGPCGPSPWGGCVPYLLPQPNQKHLLRSQTWVKISSGPDSSTSPPPTCTKQILFGYQGSFVDSCSVFVGLGTHPSLYLSWNAILIKTLK